MASVPFLPGYSFADPTRTNFAKTQSLGYKNGYALSGGPTPPPPESPDVDINLNTLTFTTTTTINNSAIATKTDAYLHPGIEYYKKVLSFEAYTSEEVNAVSRYKYVKINYFLEDDTIQILEPKIPNSGTPQGVLLRRQKIPIETGKWQPNAQTYHWTDLQVGVDIVIFGREYHIRDCDPFTRGFYLEKKGIELHDPEPEPASPATIAVGSSAYQGGRPSSPASRAARYTPSKGVNPEDRLRLRKFLDNDRKVLRFYCVWDDTASLFGERRNCVLHYFLVDDTIEVRELLAANSGRDPCSTFMKKQRLPKPNGSSPVKGTGKGGVPGVGVAVGVEYYTPADLRVGETIVVFGRKFSIYDLDLYTREYYRDVYGIEDFPVSKMQDDAPVAQDREIPPYTGIGSEEDSLANCLSLVPKAPRKAMPKNSFMATEILRFSATLKSNKKDDAERDFVVSYHLQDDTMSVFENPIKGIRGGKFAERKKMKNPNKVNLPLDAQYYTPGDLHTGGVISVHNHLFNLNSADTFTTNFLSEYIKK